MGFMNPLNKVTTLPFCTRLQKKKFKQEAQMITFAKFIKGNQRVNIISKMDEIIKETIRTQKLRSGIK